MTDRPWRMLAMLVVVGVALVPLFCPTRGQVVRGKIYRGLPDTTIQTPQDDPETVKRSESDPEILKYGESDPEILKYGESDPEMVKYDQYDPEYSDLGPEIVLKDENSPDDGEVSPENEYYDVNTPRVPEIISQRPYQDPEVVVGEEGVPKEGRLGPGVNGGEQGPETPEIPPGNPQNGPEITENDKITPRNPDLTHLDTKITPEITENEIPGPEIPENWDIVVICLGGGEDITVMAQIASLMHSQGHKVAALIYGPTTLDETFPPAVKVLQIPVAPDDPLYPGGVASGVTPGEEVGVEWTSGRIIASRILACREATQLQWVKDVILSSKLIVFPLFLHDICVLSLAHSTRVPVVGVVTSRMGAWWVWVNMGILPSLGSTPVPPNSMDDFGIWSRAANLASHYRYLSSIRQLYQVPALTALSPGTDPPSLDVLYTSLTHVLLAWDPLIDAHAPYTPMVIPIGGFAFETGRITKDVLVPALLNRAGVVSVCPGGSEAWVGPDALNALYNALKMTPYTILWRASYDLLQPNISQDDSMRDKFIFKKYLPLSDVLNHPRHRLLVSTCGETEVMAAVYFGSPVLCLPVTTDQTLAAAVVEDLGLAVVVPAKEATTSTLTKALSKLSGNRSYRECGRQLGEELHDQALSPADRVLFTLERALRRPHSRRHIPRPTHLSLLQQSNADVYLLLLVLLTCLSGLLILLTIVMLPILLKKQKRKAD
ncbi:putative UDP-glucuronosyltransferase ugt-60 [Homarus americanus]|uniref:putative UDP-glucuronosyltransferase ugt-60 n=1 Tax=Homarus americanus TaxID=6706 RepID=UPI001C493DAC|nr:putative UDP-glucuronosyltransferase ugt-60 [Homarus americanus]XP_042209485.1 putative UDP-glucuronosyltransferase ugt-60 [Homarus americanus]XP_042209486.1 putative UDP-glucuronosyltransferase ugt-60 [Homarus americanus]XP_042209487.1 putative UDP-glucuronosyltransferase ugt-60 [Homarus americanus]XP_042209488.1 putative UDP-glucuronosyltransferase ugt-60 [Homarus americanus]XP_042209489.1 putative UDP-glucuronosyltransferase ugt-60 [Homarus americanus]XP_042209490.1 putative UDP-glucuro